MDVLDPDQELVSCFLQVFKVVERLISPIGEEDRLISFISLCHHPHCFLLILFSQRLTDIVKITVIKDIVQAVEVIYAVGILLVPAQTHFVIFIFFDRQITSIYCQ